LCRYALVTRFNCVHVCRIFPADWHQLVLKGAWVGAAAGGPPELPDGRSSGSWGNNPQYRITVASSCEVLLSLLQRDVRVAHGEGRGAYTVSFICFMT
jgi:hypothetical protein